MTRIGLNDLGYIAEKGVPKEVVPMAIEMLVTEYIQSKWYQEPVPYDRSFIAFLNDKYKRLRFEPISDTKWAIIKKEIAKQLKNG